MNKKLLLFAGCFFILNVSNAQKPPLDKVPPLPPYYTQTYLGSGEHISQYTTIPYGRKEIKRTVEYPQDTIIKWYGTDGWLTVQKVIPFYESRALYEEKVLNITYSDDSCFTVDLLITQVYQTHNDTSVHHVTKNYNSKGLLETYIATREEGDINIYFEYYNSYNWPSTSIRWGLTPKLIENSREHHYKYIQLKDTTVLIDVREKTDTSSYNIADYKILYPYESSLIAWPEGHNNNTIYYFDKTGKFLFSESYGCIIVSQTWDFGVNVKAGTKKKKKQKKQEVQKTEPEGPTWCKYPPYTIDDRIRNKQVLLFYY